MTDLRALLHEPWCPKCGTCFPIDISDDDERQDIRCRGCDTACVAPLATALQRLADEREAVKA